MSTMYAEKNSSSQEQSTTHQYSSRLPTPASSNGHLGTTTRKLSQEFLCSCCCRLFTRWTEAYALPNQEPETVARKLVEEFFFRFSLPEQLHSDQGRQLESTIIK